MWQKSWGDALVVSELHKVPVWDWRLFLLLTEGGEGSKGTEQVGGGMTC